MFSAIAREFDATAGPPGGAHAFQSPGCLPEPACKSPPQNPDPPPLLVMRWPLELQGGPRSGCPASAERGSQESEARCFELHPEWQATRRAQVPMPGGSAAFASHPALRFPGLSPRRKGSAAGPFRQQLSAAGLGCPTSEFASGTAGVGRFPAPNGGREQLTPSRQHRAQQRWTAGSSLFTPL